MKVLKLNELKDIVDKKELAVAACVTEKKDIAGGDGEASCGEFNTSDPIEQEIKKNIKKYVVYFLSRREYSFHELLQKLEAKQYDSELAQHVLNKLKEDGLQSDMRFTEMFIRSRIAKLSGPFKLRMELKQKGISSAMIDQGISESDCDWFELALEAAKKKTFSWKILDAQGKSKLIRFLQGRGFDQEQIRYATENISKDNAL